MSDETTPRVVFRAGKSVDLCVLSKDDAPLLQRWMNDPEISQFLNRVFPASFEEETAWIEGLAEKKQGNVVLGIALKDGILIGTIGLHQINWIDRHATTGTLIGAKDCWSKGYGTEAKMLLLDFVFNGLGLHKVLSHVFVFNGRSRRYGEKCGYKVEGVLKEQHYHNGEFHDELVMAVFRKDWLPLWEAWKSNQ
jgi:RimJ/RimL family protein N-acetyltransferase